MDSSLIMDHTKAKKTINARNYEALSNNTSRL